MTRRFLAAIAAVLGAGMLILGSWVGARIEDGVVNQTAASAVVFTDSLIEPLLQGLDRAPVLSDRSRSALDALLASAAIAKRINSIKVWAPDRTILYSTRKEQIGQVDPASDKLKQALGGSVAATLDRMHEDVRGSSTAGELRPMLEVFAPIRSASTGRVIAVVESCVVADTLLADLSRARWQTWLLVAALTLAMLATVFGIVREGSRTIEHQRLALESRVSQLSLSLAQIHELRSRVDRANRRAVECNEQFLRRIGSELHDGPLQLLQLALLRLHMWRQQLGSAPSPPTAEAEHGDVLQNALTDAVRELRSLASGLVLPEIEKLSLEAALSQSADLHEQRTGTRVERAIDDLGTDLPVAVKCCLFRFSQEGLNNAFRYAGGKGQVLIARREGEKLHVEVVDDGPGFGGRCSASIRVGLGIAGLRHRVEALGGTFKVDASQSGGSRLIATFDVPCMRYADV